jgi:peptide deformylase
MKLEILTYPDDRLRQDCHEVEEFNEELRNLSENMLETMYEAPGVGLAAIQVGVTKRMVVIDVDYDLEENPDGSHRVLNKKPRVFVNPEVVEKEGKTVYKEGCLSVPGVYEEVSRAQKILCRYQDLDGKTHEVRVGDNPEETLLAVCIQHEIDHLDGKLFIDRLSPMKRDFTKKRLLKEMKKLEMA